MQLKFYKALSEPDATEWDSFLAAANHQHPRQNPVFAASERVQGLDILYVMGREKGVLQAVGMFSLEPHPLFRNRFREARCLSGPICDDAETMAVFLRDALAHEAFSKIGRVKITPYWLDDRAAALSEALSQQGWAGSDDGEFRQTGCIDITPPAEQILVRFSKSARRELRRAKRQEVHVRPITAETEARAFLDSLNRLRRRRDLRAFDEAVFMQSFTDIYETGTTGRILGAFRDEVFLAGLLIYRSRHTAHGRHFTTETQLLRDIGNLRISPLLWLEGMVWAQAQGCRSFDVEGYREPSDAADKMYNIYKYKSELSPRLTRRIGERVKTSNPFLHLTGNGKNLLKARIKKLIRTSADPASDPG